MKVTLLRKLLTFILPITMMPFFVIMIFYYMYLHKVLENDVIDLQKNLLIYIVDDVKEMTNDPSKLEFYINSEDIALQEVTVFDKEMNIIAMNFDLEGTEWLGQRYNKEGLEQHFKKVFQSQNYDTLHNKKHNLLIKPIVNNNKIVAYLTSNYKSTVDEKMVAINQTFLYLLFVIIFTVFIISIFIIIFSLKLLHPLELLIEGIKKITAGDLSFTIKNVSNDEIGVVVDAFNHMTQKRKHIEEALEELAIRDGLTGLYNHKFFYTSLEKEIARDDRYHNTVSLLLIDIDHFKNVNDTYGHRAGDTILRALSQRLMTRARNTDYVCRYGGEEIAVILIETNITEAQAIAEELRILIEKEPFLIEDGRYIPITVSIGVSAYSEEAKDASMMVSNADNALYSAKENGRNQVCIFEKKA
ncbi:diguanylate cyclase [Campylobacterota bacterium]